MHLSHHITLYTLTFACIPYVTLLLFVSSSAADPFPHSVVGDYQVRSTEVFRRCRFSAGNAEFRFAILDEEATPFVINDEGEKLVGCTANDEIIRFRGNTRLTPFHARRFCKRSRVKVELTWDNGFKYTERVSARCGRRRKRCRWKFEGIASRASIAPDDFKGHQCAQGWKKRSTTGNGCKCDLPGCCVDGGGVLQCLLGNVQCQNGQIVATPECACPPA